ncbi:hypothetical protein CDAR_480141 [Caerostris darwini]|uniref:Uncharacterized protein n=1 Tax=Caerostris darwini TaxID=1538125 RepID=A0AAV4Q625_9ARAC|nr:hypothetical protein CDAR_480141 [Caerostris darwini]
MVVNATACVTDTPLYEHPFLLCTLVPHSFPREREGEKKRDEILHGLLPLNLPRRAMLISGRGTPPPPPFTFPHHLGSRDYGGGGRKKEGE